MKHRPESIKELHLINPYIPGKPIEEVKRLLKIDKVYKLASNENPFPPPLSVRKEIINSINCLNRYPDASSFYLKRELSKRFKVSKSKIFLGNGSDEIITLVLKAFINKGDEVIISFPTFLIYKIQSILFRAKVVEVPINKDYRYDLWGMFNKITKRTKIIFIANPDNPTGTYINERELFSFIRKIRRNIIIYLDEAYFEYALKERDYPRSLKLLDRYENIIISRTFSKARGLAGLRIGYAFSSPFLVSFLEKVREPFNVNSIAQRAALQSLKDEKYLKKVVDFTLQQKEYIYSQLSKMKVKFIPTATNFVPVYVGENVDKVCSFLLKEGIIVRNLNSWGLKGFIRVTVGKISENKAFIKAFRKMMQRGGIV